MLVFVTAPRHGYTVKSLVERTFGADIPACRSTSYDALFGSGKTIRATHIFTDFERLYDWELLLASDVYRAVQKAGLPCLNDPARVMCRYELLQFLHRAGINPFTAYRADEAPRPSRFPVFVRAERDHAGAVSPLLPDQQTLDACLQAMRTSGVPLRGMMVIEYAAEPIASGVWRKFGTFRVGEAVLVDHSVVENSWQVKYGTLGLATEEMFEEEHEAVISNRFAEQLKPVFDISGAEWGRADHAMLAGRLIVYEVNTNPTLDSLSPQRLPIRDKTLGFARKRMAEQLWKLDWGDGSPVQLPATERLAHFRRRAAALGWVAMRP